MHSLCLRSLLRVCCPSLWSLSQLNIRRLATEHPNCRTWDVFFGIRRSIRIYHDLKIQCFRCFAPNFSLPRPRFALTTGCDDSPRGFPAFPWPNLIASDLGSDLQIFQIGQLLHSKIHRSIFAFFGVPYMQYICDWWFSDSTYSQSIIISSFPSLPKHFGSHFFFGKFSSSNKLITQIFPLSFFWGGCFGQLTKKKATPPVVFSVSDPRIDPIVPCQVVLMAPEEFTFLCESFAAAWYPQVFVFFWNTKDMMFFFYDMCLTIFLIPGVFF